MRLAAHDYSANGPEDGKKPLRAKGKRSGTKHRHFTLEELKPALKRKLWTNERFKKVCDKFLKATRFSLNKAWNELDCPSACGCVTVRSGMANISTARRLHAADWCLSTPLL